MSTPFQAAIDKGIKAHGERSFDVALASYRDALALRPDDAEALSLCGLALVHSGAPAEALPLLTRAVEREPGEAGLRMNLVEGLLQLNDTERARQELNAILASDPGNVRARQRLHPLDSQAFIIARDWPALRTTASNWTRSSPGNHTAWRAAARAAFEMGLHTEACHAFEQVLTLVPANAADLAAYGGLSLHALRFDAAAAALDKVESLDPQYAPMLASRALLSMYLGKFAESEDYCRRCLARDPDYIPAYTTLSRVRRGGLAENDLAALARAASNPEVPLDYRVSAVFAIAHAHDARGDTDTAFAAYEEAHALALQRDLQEGRSFDVASGALRSERTIELSAAVPRLEAQTNAPRPIFIVGMPRSGTTLVESVLGAHSKVVACGERPQMQQILRAMLASPAGSVDTQTAQAWAASYFSGLPKLDGADHITDKHPLNFEAIGLIARLMPDAVIVHLRRSPVETGLSIYRQEFNKHWPFVHRLEDIGAYYAQYARLMARWEQELPGRIATIQYEDFVQDFETAAPELLRACGLAWEPQCLEFQRNPRAIATFSTVQARDPVRLAPSRAERYGERLQPLIAALNSAGVDLRTGALAS